jgi:hypothetical protein
MTLVDDFADGFAEGFGYGFRGLTGSNNTEADYGPFILLGSFLGFFIGLALFIKGLQELKEKRRKRGEQP